MKSKYRPFGPVFITLLLSLSVPTLSHAAVLDYFGWGYSQNKVYEKVKAYVDKAGNIIGLVGVIAPPAAKVGAVIKTVSVVADIIDPPSTNSIISGRLSLTFDSSETVLGFGWYGEFGENTSLDAPMIGETDESLFFSLLQKNYSSLMESASISVDQSSGKAVFEFNWGSSGFTPSDTNDMNSDGHFNIMAIYYAVIASDPMGDPKKDLYGGTVIGNFTDTAKLGTSSATYMLCKSGFCGVNSVPEPTSLVLLGLGLAGFGFSRKKKT